MTGHGSSRGRVGRSALKVEVRSVNHRFCETNIRLPGRLSILENEVAQRIRKKFVRGKFDLFLKEESVDQTQAELELARRSYRVLSRIRRAVGIEEPIGLQDLILFRSTASSGVSQEDPSAMRGGVLKLVDLALGHLGLMRAKEGRHLQKWFEKKLARLKSLLNRIEVEVGRIQKRQKKENASRLKEAEMASLPVPRGDVTEEIVRLKSHLDQFAGSLSQGEAIGRRVDFLVQEMVREINTLGSKVLGVRAVHLVVDFKAELEKVREQIQNVE